MAADVSGQVAVPAGRPAVSDGIPILAAKITVPDVPEWAVPRTQITKLIAEGTRRCPLTSVTGPPGAGQNDGAGAVGGGRAWDGCLDLPG